MKNLTDEELKIYNEGYDNGYRKGVEEIQKKCAIKLDIAGRGIYYISYFLKLDLGTINRYLAEYKNNEDFKKYIDSEFNHDSAFDIDFTESMNNFTINAYKREGYNDGVKEIALKLRKQGYDISYIAKILELTPEKAEELLADYKE